MPLAEDLEAYEAQILDEAAIKRTLTSITTYVLCTVALQTADLSAPLAPDPPPHPWVAPALSAALRAAVAGSQRVPNTCHDLDNPGVMRRMPLV